MLADRLFELESFKRQYEALLVISVCDTIKTLDWHENKEDLLQLINWNNILSIASALVYSNKNKHLDAALRIAQTALLEPSTEEFQKNAAASILINLTNNPAANLAIQRGLITQDFKDKLPLSVRLQNDRILFENSILLNDDLISLNRFQKEVYESHKSNSAVSISAPTSAGKSFILCNIIIEELLEATKNIVYIVPTRALISQVESDLIEFVEKYELVDVNISTVPQSSDDHLGSNIFVFTQERLHWYLIENSSSNIDLIIIDEAHKIEDSYRGILLQQKIEDVVKTNADVKVFFSSPFTSNPELLLENVRGERSKASINTQFIAVNQNLIFATQVRGKTDKWELSLCLIDQAIKLGTINLKGRTTSERKKMAFIAVSFSSNEYGNVIYSNGAAEAEETALVLFDVLENERISKEVKDLIKLVKKTVHKDYRLAKVLEKGIAFHYGNMPLLIRQEIERLFKLGKIKYLICTSTLLEGVNLPAKSIYIRKPTRGSNNPLNQNDFWNLAGRAGRLGKEFSGNIVCVEPSKWEIEPNPNKHKQKIVRAIDIVKNNIIQLQEYINDGSPREVAESRQDLEFAFGYYYIKFLDGEIMNIGLPQALINKFIEIKKTIKLPDYVIKRNPGISPLAQQELFDYFTKREDIIESLIPVYPEDENAFNEYASLIEQIGTTLSKYPMMLNRSRSVLLLNWMRGRPLSYIIKSSFASYQSNPKYQNKKLHTVIREVMESIENFARFRFAKDSSCYVDILRYFLEVNNRPELIDNIPELNLWLEFGVSQKTHLSLLSLGLSRNTVIEVSEFITDSEMNKQEVLYWLRDNNLEQYGLSEIIINDIKNKIK